MRTFLTNFKFTNMSQRLPQGTRLWVNINRCKGLPNVRMGRRTSERLTKQRVEKAQKKLSGVIRSITENNWRGAKKGIEEAQVALRRAEAVLRDMGSEVVPNPFAALRVEGDAYNEQSLSETRVIGSTNGPLWNTERSNIPFAIGAASRVEQIAHGEGRHPRDRIASAKPSGNSAIYTVQLAWENSKGAFQSLTQLRIRKYVEPSSLYKQNYGSAANDKNVAMVCTFLRFPSGSHLFKCTFLLVFINASHERCTALRRDPSLIIYI